MTQPPNEQFETLKVFLSSHGAGCKSMANLLRVEMDDEDFDTYQMECVRACCAKMDGLAETIERTLVALRTKPA